MTEAKTKTADQEAASAVNVKVTEAELTAARKEGALQAAKDAGKDAFRYAQDNLLAADSGVRQFTGMHDIMQYEPLLGLGVAEFEKAVADGGDTIVPEEKAAGLLELERSGQNRTPYVQALCKRLGVKSPYEVTNAGPAYTNDVSVTQTAV
jgi:hypothetical protein